MFKTMQVKIRHQKRDCSVLQIPSFPSPSTFLSTVSTACVFMFDVFLFWLQSCLCPCLAIGQFSKCVYLFLVLSLISLSIYTLIFLCLVAKSQPCLYAFPLLILMFGKPLIRNEYTEFTHLQSCCIVHHFSGLIYKSFQDYLKLDHLAHTDIPECLSSWMPRVKH